MRSSITCYILVLTLAACQKSSGTSNMPEADKPSQQITVTQTIDGILRSFIVYLPTGYNNAGKMPMILAIHGGSGTPEGMIAIANFKPIAEKDKVVLIYPAGIEKNWNDGRPTAPNQLGINDVSFFNRLCDYMISNYPVDGSRIYATGISNGGFMSSRLGCELSSRIAAIAVVAATMETTTIEPGCNPGRPVPAIYIHGTADPLVPFAGGTVMGNATAGGTVSSHFQVVAKWVALNNCTVIPATSDLPDISNDGTTIRQRIYANGTAGSEVVSYVINNGGHTWPQGNQYLPVSIVGITSQDMNGCEVIWNFFKRFKRT